MRQIGCLLLVVLAWIASMAVTYVLLNLALGREPQWR